MLIIAFCDACNHEMSLVEACYEGKEVRTVFRPETGNICNSTVCVLPVLFAVLAPVVFAFELL